MRSTLSLIMGSTAARAVGLVTMPVLTRLYSPQDFGLMSFFVSVTTVLGSILTLRYVVALPIPKQEARARALLLLNVILVITLSLFLAGSLATLFVSPGREWVESRFDAFWLSNWWLIPIGAAGFAFYEILSMWATRERSYSAISRSQLWQAVTGAGVKLVGGFTTPGPLALVSGQIIQQSGGIFGLLSSFTAAIRRALLGYRARHILSLSARYSDFPCYKLPSHFIYALAAQAPILFSSYMWDTSTTGQLGLAFQAIALPVALVSQNASRVYYAELAAIGKSNPQAALKLTYYMVARLFFIGLCACVGLLVLAPTLFQLAFGSDWALSGELARALAIYIPAQFVASPLITAYNIYGSQRQALFLHTVRAALVCGVFIVCHLLNVGVVATIYAYAVMISLHYGLTCYRVIKAIGNDR